MKDITIALIGNPNAGKTTLFNHLTNSREYVGNWAGVTVEKKIGRFENNSTKFTLVDLPGIYSLSPYSIEEKVSKNFIVNDQPDIVLNIVDASNLERNLYLTVQLLELKRPTIIALNMIDELENMGCSIKADELSRELGAYVVPISASKGINIDLLLDKINEVAAARQMPQSSSFEQYSNNIKSICSNDTDEEKDILIEKRYEYIKNVCAKSLVKNNSSSSSFSDRLDNIITNRFLAIPIFLLVLIFGFQITFSWVGQPISDLLDSFISGPLTSFVSNVLSSLDVAKWLKDLIVNGILQGVGGIIVFFPLIFILFLFISILEDSGYMARVAFIMDSAMRKIGLSGKAFIPMILGFGCSVPAIMAARTMEDEKDKKLLTLIVPLMSCNARLPLYALFAGIFFKGYESLVVISLYLLGVFMAIVMGLIFKNTLFRGEPLPFIMELPKYKVPTVKGIVINSWDKSKGFLQKAGTIIFGMSVLVWFLSNYNFTGKVGLSNSILAHIGKAIAPIFSVAGFGDWKAAISLLTGLLAKEVVVSTMNVVYGLKGVSHSFTQLSAYAFMVFVLLYTPCISAVATIKKELNSWKWTIFSVAYQFVLALAVSTLIYRIGMAFGIN